MSNEESRPSVGQMLRMTGTNTATFMEQVAEHVEKLEAEVAQLGQRITELEAANVAK